MEHVPALKSLTFSHATTNLPKNRRLTSRESPSVYLVGAGEGKADLVLKIHILSLWLALGDLGLKTSEILLLELPLRMRPVAAPWAW